MNNGNRHYGESQMPHFSRSGTLRALDSFRQAAMLVRRHSQQAKFSGPASAESIRIAETLLNVSFPVSYRAFLQEFGAGSFCGGEFYGVLDGEVPGSTVPCAVWATLADRQHSAFPETFVTLMTTTWGPLVCFDLARVRGDEPPIVFWNPDISPGESLDVVAANFGDFFLQETTRLMNSVNRRP
jgi:hypothetical protein